jgi:mannose-6-phosphate isomerase-like protein (cupin superfamily)
MKELIEIFTYSETGYKPCLITSKWQAALLNYADTVAFSAMNRVEKHEHTDEVFVLLEGTATLIAAEFNNDGTVRWDVKPLQTGVIYNIPIGVWHNVAMSEDARIFIVEDANTHLNDVIYQSLSEAQQQELNKLLL